MDLKIPQLDIHLFDPAALELFLGGIDLPYDFSTQHLGVKCFGPVQICCVNGKCPDGSDLQHRSLLILDRHLALCLLLMVSTHILFLNLGIKAEEKQ